MTRIALIVTTHDMLGSTGKKTGTYLPELAHPYEVFRKAGFEADFISPRGGQVPLDGVDRKDAATAAFLDDAEAMGRLHTSIASKDVDPSRYDAVFFAGGHGTMWDFATDASLQRLAAAVFERGGVVGAVCHGPAGIADARLSDGTYLVRGKRVASFTNEEERAVGLETVVPFLLEDRLRAHGATHIPAPNWAKNVVVDGRLVTGQNPASARGVGESMRDLLA